MILLTLLKNISSLINIITFISALKRTSYIFSIKDVQVPVPQISGMPAWVSRTYVYTWRGLPSKHEFSSVRFYESVVCFYHFVKSPLIRNTSHECIFKRASTFIRGIISPKFRINHEIVTGNRNLDYEIQSRSGWVSIVWNKHVSMTIMGLHPQSAYYNVNNGVHCVLTQSRIVS